MIGGGIGGFILAIAILMIRPNNPQILMAFTQFSKDCSLVLSHI